MLQPVVDPVLITSHHGNECLESLNIDINFNDENDFHNLNNNLTGKDNYFLYMGSSPGTNRYILFCEILLIILLILLAMLPTYGEKNDMQQSLHYLEIGLKLRSC